MAWLVLLGSGMLLGSVTILEQGWLKLLLAVVFLATGFAIRTNVFRSYLLFIFVYPLLPSQLVQLSPFDYLEFLFLCFAFWWALTKIISRDQALPSSTMNVALGWLLLIFSVSVLLALLRHHHIFSEVFYLKLKESWSVFQNSGSSELAPVQTFIHFLEGITFFYITVDVLRSNQQIEKTGRVIVYSAVLVALAGIFQRLFRFKLLEYWIAENPNIARVNSTFSDPNSLGTFLASIFCFTVFAFLAGRFERYKWFIAFAGALFIALLLTASRAAYAATFLTLLFIPAIAKWLGISPFPHLRKGVAWAAKIGPYVAVAILLALFTAAAWINYSDPRPDSLIKMVLFTFNPQLSLDEILKGRPELWKTAFSVFESYPVFGAGLGSFRSLRSAPYFVVLPENTHNYFLQILAETGIPGFLLFCLLIVTVFLHARRSMRDLSGSEFLFRFGLTAGLFAFLLTCLTGHPLLLVKLQLLFWGLAGMLMADSRETTIKKTTNRRRIAFALVGVILLLAFVMQVHQISKTKQLVAYEYGYHPWERDDRGVLFRWTEAKAISILDIQGEVLNIHLRQLNPEVLTRPGHVNVYINDHLVDTVRFIHNEWLSRQYFVKHLAAGVGRATVRIEPDRVFTPHGSEDKRALGVVLKNFSWECSISNPIGVYEQEREGDKSYFWTGAQSSFLVDRQGNTLHFRILPNLLAETRPLDAQFYWDSKPLQKLTFTRSRWEPVALRIPDEGNRTGFLTLRVSATANLKQLHRGEDSRDLGARIELPFRWSGPPFMHEAAGTSLLHRRTYGVSNNGNHPVRLLFFPLDRSFATDFAIIKNGTELARQAGLFDSVSSGDTGWQRIHPEKPFTLFREAFVWRRVEKMIDLSPGPILIRMNALGSIVGDDPVLVGLRIDDKEVARQPILFEDWHDYFFCVDLPRGGKKISVEFLNDFFLPALKLDRNLMIKEIAIAKKASVFKITEGWDRVPGGIIVAESVGRDFPFLPRNQCYTMKRQK